MKIDIKDIIVIALSLGLTASASASESHLLSSEEIRQIEMMIENGAIQFDPATRRPILNIDILKVLENDGSVRIMLVHGYDTYCNG